VARYLDCGVWDNGYVVTQSVPSLHYADAVASDDHASASPLKGQTFDVLQTGPQQLMVRVLGGLAMRAPEGVDGRRWLASGDE